jgi:hypothetical protein
MARQTDFGIPLHACALAQESTTVEVDCRRAKRGLAMKGAGQARSRMAYVVAFSPRGR